MGCFLKIDKTLVFLQEDHISCQIFELEKILDNSFPISSMSNSGKEKHLCIILNAGGKIHLIRYKYQLGIFFPLQNPMHLGEKL